MSTASPAPVHASTALPSGFQHRHASEEARAIAENGMILRVQATGRGPAGDQNAEARLAALRDSAAIADQPDRPWVDGWLHRSYQSFWDRGH